MCEAKKIILKWFNIYEKKVVCDVVIVTLNYMDRPYVVARDFDARIVVTPIHSIIIKTNDTRRKGEEEFCIMDYKRLFGQTVN